MNKILKSKRIASTVLVLCMALSILTACSSNRVKMSKDSEHYDWYTQIGVENEKTLKAVSITDNEDNVGIYFERKDDADYALATLVEKHNQLVREGSDAINGLKAGFGVVSASEKPLEYMCTDIESLTGTVLYFDAEKLGRTNDGTIQYFFIDAADIVNNKELSGGSVTLDIPVVIINLGTNTEWALTEEQIKILDSFPNLEQLVIRYEAEYGYKNETNYELVHEYKPDVEVYGSNWEELFKYGE